MFSDRELRYFDVAKAVSETANHNSFMIGAAIVVGKSIISVGANDKDRSHPLQKKYNAFRFNDDKCKHSIHAEIDAITKAKNQIDDFSDAKLFVYRLQKNGNLGIARPCKGCMEAIKDFGIKEIYYSTNEGLAYERIMK